MLDFKRFIKDKKITQTDVALVLGVKQSYVSRIISGMYSLSEDHIRILEAKYGDISAYNNDEYADAFKTKGESIVTGKLIPLFDADAAAGTTYEMNMTAISRPIAMIEIGGLLKDSESALRVYGNSMTPNYPAGCVVGLRPHADSFIEPGSVYVVETNENRYLKRLYYNAHKTAFRCVSDNHMVHDGGPMNGDFYYPDFEIPFDEVRRLCRVVGVIKRNIL